ncbi:MAG: hypothetical protein GXO35_00055 [Gammaproteobacteria bacterium]|nr:hypothetical protein [Gammaproteobacteria bacterium]
MSISMSKIQGYLDEAGVNYEDRDETTIVFPMSDDENKIIILVKLMEDGEYIQLRTLKHLDDLVAEASEEKRIELLKWMLNKNYSSKLGAWEYDPDDHDHHLAVGHSIEDGDLTMKQFLRMFKVVANSLEAIPEMKEVLGIGGISAKEKKRQALLKELEALDDDDGI